jgi:hypothetical protein
MHVTCISMAESLDMPGRGSIELSVPYGHYNIKKTVSSQDDGFLGVGWIIESYVTMSSISGIDSMLGCA